jgi:Uncharacterized protein involved in tolerance to divalent cations
MDIVLVYATASSAEEARSIASTVVGERLAACANILPSVQSIYWWDGKMETAGETALILKTRQDLSNRLIDRIRGLHSYDCPCIVAIRVTQGNPAFLDWISRETLT